MRDSAETREFAVGDNVPLSGQEIAVKSYYRVRRNCTASRVHSYGDLPVVTYNVRRSLLLAFGSLLREISNSNSAFTMMIKCRVTPPSK